jgi:hypothetical protein
MIKKTIVPRLFVLDGESTGTYAQSIKFRKESKWREAGEKLMECARVHKAMGMLLEAATLYTEAAEAYLKVDKSEALSAYRLSIKVYCDVGRFDIAGKLERIIAYSHYNNRHWEDAAFHFKKSANFFSGDRLMDQSDLSLEKYAECLSRVGEYFEASRAFQTVAQSCVNTNLRRFNARDFLLKSIICLLSVPIDTEAEFFLLERKEAKIKAEQDAKLAMSFGFSSKSHKPGSFQEGSKKPSFQDGSKKSSFQEGPTVAVADAAGLNTDNSLRHPSSDNSTAATLAAEPQSSTKTTDDDVAAGVEAGEDQEVEEDENLTEFFSFADKYEKILRKVKYFGRIDFLWLCSKERQFLNNIIKFRQDLDKGEFMDHVSSSYAKRPMPLCLHTL